MSDPYTPTPYTPTSRSSIINIRIKPSVRNMIFICMVSISLFTNLDGGIIPKATSTIIKSMHIQEGEMGNYSSSDYLGRIIGSVLFVVLINKINRLLLLVLTLILKAITLIIPFIFMHSLTFDSNSKTLYYICLICRFASGISQVYYTIYLPVWCDQYGKKSSNTIMIMLIQLGLPAGIVLGYGIETLIDKWEVSFLIQGIICCIIAFFMLSFPLLYFSFDLVLVDGTDNEMTSTTQNDDPLKQFEHKSSLCSNICQIIKEKVYLLTGFSNSVVFFGMAVVQFWVTVYMEEVLGLSGTEHQTTVFIIFASVCVTSPPIGVLVGGLVGSKLGGYTNKRATLLCVLFAFMSCIFGIGVGYLDTTWHVGFAIGLWLYFFFVSAMSPLQTGIIISSLPEKLRGDGFSIMNIFLNAFGNLPGAAVYGWIYEKYKGQQIALRATMFYNIFGLICMILGMMFRYRKGNNMDNIDDIDDMEYEETTKGNPHGEMLPSETFSE